MQESLAYFQNQRHPQEKSRHQRLQLEFEHRDRTRTEAGMDLAQRQPRMEPINWKKVLQTGAEWLKFLYVTGKVAFWQVSGASITDSSFPSNRQDAHYFHCIGHTNLTL